MEQNQVIKDSKQKEDTQEQIQQKSLNSFLTSITVPLPSKGLVYDTNSSLFKRETVDVREMTANEEDILTSLNLIRTGRVMDEIVNACMLTKDIDIGKMIVGDRNSIITGLILASYGSKYKVDVKCESCNEINKRYEFDINNLPVKWLGAEPIYEGVNEFEFTLPKSNKRITFSLATSEDEKEISQVVNRLKAASNRETNVTTRLKKLIKSIDGETDKRKIAEFIDRGMMPILDSVELRNFIELISPDIDTKQDFICTHCGFSERINMPIDFNFFWRTQR